MVVEPIQACKAAALARELSDTGLFLLVESAAFRKSSGQRAFSRERFEMVSIGKRVEGGKEAVESAVNGLLQKGFMGSLGANLVHATSAGNLVKHTYRMLRVGMRFQDVGPAQRRSVRLCSTLRHEMAEICKRQQME